MEKICTIPNLLSMSRIPLSILFVIQIINSQYLYATITLSLIGITDFFDGYLARKLKQTTKIGKIIDPLSDKISIITVLTILVITNKIPAYALIILTRDLVIILAVAFIYLKKTSNIKKFKSNMYGKILTTIQFIAIIVIIIYPKTTPYWIAIIIPLTIISLADYYKKFLKKAITR